MLRALMCAFFALFAYMAADVAFADAPPADQNPPAKQADPPAPRRFVISRRKEGDGGSGGGDNTPDPLKKARDKQKEADDAAAKIREIEGVVAFNHGISDFVKTNSDLLPGEISAALDVVLKEKYDTAADKSRAIQEMVVHSFFQVQSNLDLLTPKQKSELEEYQKLTKNGRAEKASQVYQGVFEPALAQLRAVKKAEELARGRSGISYGTDADRAYKEKIMAISRKHYFREA